MIKIKIKPPQKTKETPLSKAVLVGNKTSGATKRKTRGISNKKNKLSSKAVIITIAVERPNAIFSLFNINIATETPPTTPGDIADANSQIKITLKADFQDNSL